MLFPRTRSILLLVVASLALAAIASFLLVTFVDVQPMWAVRPKRMPGGVWVTYYPDRDYEKIQKKFQGKLNQPVDWPESFPPDGSLQDALNYLGEKYKLTFFLDTNAIGARQIREIRNRALGPEVLEAVSLKSVLHIFLHQRGLTFRHCNRGIVVTTTWPPQRYPGRVDVACDYEPLENVLTELAKKTGAGILQDHLGEQGHRPVTVVLNDVEVETAVRVLVEMTDLAAADGGNGNLVVSNREIIRRIMGGTSVRPIRAIPSPVRRPLEPLLPDNASPKRR